MRKKIPLIGGIINLIESLKGDIGIIENTDVATHSISAGSYVIWHNELYKASSAIAVDDALSSSNLTAVSGGAANELNNKISPTLSPSFSLIDSGASSTSERTYTAVKDCVVTVRGNVNSTKTQPGIVLSIGGVALFQCGGNNISAYGIPFNYAVSLLKGQTLTITPSGGMDAEYKVYG